MRAAIALLFAFACSIASYSAPAIAQHHASKQKTEKPKTDAELIASAMSAAPPAISRDATVVAVGSDGKLRTLRIALLQALEQIAIEPDGDNRCNSTMEARP